MQYDLSSELDRARLKVRWAALVRKGAVVDLTEKNFRTKRQNNYIHLLIGVVAMETGNTLQDTKDYYFKRTVNPDIFVESRTDKMGNTIHSLRSSKTITKEQMSTAIDRFKRWGYENGFHMPDENEESLLEAIAKEMGRNSAYLGGYSD